MDRRSNKLYFHGLMPKGISYVSKNVFFIIRYSRFAVNFEKIVASRYFWGKIETKRDRGFVGISRISMFTMSFKAASPKDF